MLTKQKTLSSRGTRAESSQVREFRRTALPGGSQSQVLWEWSQFLSCLWPVILTSPCLVCGSGPLLGAYAPLSQDGFQNQGSWEVGCLVSPIGLSHVLLVSLQGSTVFLIRDSCYETTQWRGYCCAWPRWTVSVSSSPTLAYILSIHQVDNFIVYTYIEYSYIQILLETEIF